MNEYITFDKFITPIIIQILFWVGLAGIVVYALFAIINGQGVGGLVILLVGPIVLRVYMEILLVMFKIYEELREINLKGGTNRTFS